MGDQPSLGGKVGGRIASLVSASTVTTRQRLAPHNLALAMQIQDAFFRTVGSEIRETVGEPLARVADNPSAPEWARKTFDFLSRGQGQWQTFLAQQVAGSAMGAGLGAFFENELTPVLGAILNANPNLLLSPDSAAGLVARGLWSPDAGRLEAGRQGIDNTRFAHLVRGAQHPPDIASIQIAYLRGIISVQQMAEMLKESGLTDEAMRVYVALAQGPLTAGEAADMVQRGIISETEGEEIAHHNGVSTTDFRRLAEAAGQSLSLQDLLFLYRRKKISRARLEHGIRQGNVRNEWIPEAEMLGVVPMSTADAIAAAVQNHLSIGEAKTIATENGLDPAHFQPLYDTAGAPLSTTEMLQLWRRGIVTKAQVEQALREGRLKNKYIPNVLHLKKYIFPPDTVRVMYERGAISKGTALQKLAEYGVEGEDAAAYLIAAEHTKMGASRDLTMSTIRTLYEEHAISHAVAVKNLMGLGYDQTESEQILSISTLQRNQAALNRAISRVRARYVAHRIDVTQATTALDALHVPPDQRDSMIDTWNIERDLSTPQLTTSQITRAAKAGIISPDEAHQRLLDAGYATRDAAILLALSGITPGG